jgi:hypothetical protein
MADIIATRSFFFPNPQHGIGLQAHEQADIFKCPSDM